MSGQLVDLGQHVQPSETESGLRQARSLRLLRVTKSIAGMSFASRLVQWKSRVGAAKLVYSAQQVVSGQLEK